MTTGKMYLTEFCDLGVNNVRWLPAFLALLGMLWALSQRTKRGSLVSKTNNEKTTIEPLDFEWSTTEPVKFRPFKPKYHLTMGLETITPSSLLEMDKNYLKRIELRRSILTEHTDTVLGVLPPSHAAISELYTYLVKDYLPTRFWTMFALHSDTLENKVTGEHLPLTPKAPLKALETLGEHLDEDFLILLPDNDSYVLQAFVTCFPAGFNSKEKLGLRLRDIHIPVPGYKAKLEKSMDRFFARIEVGKVVKRVNWSITTHSNLYAASGNHLYENEEVEEEVIDIENTYLRCERQTLHRLPHTKALVFTFKTYLYPIKDIKDEGLGEDLAQAIDGLKEGSVPEMHFYKRGVIWGETVKEFLRS